MFSDKMIEKTRQLRLQGKAKSAAHAIRLLESLPEFAGQKMPDERTVRRWWKSNKPTNWVEAHILKHGKPPLVPDWMKPLQPWDAPSTHITKTMKFKRITKSTWDSLSESHRTQVLEVIDWQGLDKNLFIAEIAQTSVVQRDRSLGVIARRKLPQ